MTTKCSGCGEEFEENLLKDKLCGNCQGLNEQAKATPKNLDEKEIRWQAIVRAVITQRDSAMNTIAQLQGEIDVLQARNANRKN